MKNMANNLPNTRSVASNPLTPDKIKEILLAKLSREIEDTQIINQELTIRVSPNNLLKVCKFLKESDLAFNHPRCLCGVDRQEYLEVVYHLSSISRGHNLTVKVKLPAQGAKLPSLFPIYQGADWHERETSELLGIEFIDHPDPRHLLLVEDFEGYPLRKDFLLKNEP